ncbi:Uncharacterized protein FKW44_021883 [Caligus rogercresseyi]|uniref:Uncharacterized protein n=1 Tax=Caligus rogercresseyi TaxID=217165 RepID=A0A7T8GRZ3_CALRO|nr:Uncharacterized protein FKW44_021883 [Caligus rogercresseyi]
MPSEQDRCAAILVALRADRAPKEIIEFPKPLSIEKTQDRSRSKKRTPEFLHELQERINDDPSTSMRNLATKMNVDEQTIRTAVHEDLRSKSYVLKARQMLFEASRPKLALRQFTHVLNEGDVPPSSPDCNPMDYNVWGVLERESNKHSHISIVSLKASIVEVVARMNREHLVNACTRFWSRPEAVIEAEGGWFE